MENPLPLKLIEEQELFEKLLELLVLSTHSPKGRFSKDNSYIIFNLKSATTRLYDTEAKIICIVSKKGAQCIECHHKDI